MLHATAEILSPEHSQSDARCDRCCNVWRFTLTAEVIEAWPVDRTTPEARQNRARRNAVEAVGADVSWFA